MLFKVETKLDETCWKEIYWIAHSPQGKRRQIILGIIFLFGLLLCCNGVLWLIGIPVSSLITLICNLAVLMITLLEFTLGTARSTARRQIRKYKKEFGKNAIHVICSFFADYMQSTCIEKQSQKEISYSQIEWYKDTKNYFILKSRGNNTIYILSKADFSVGSVDEFRVFIQSKITF